MRSLVGAWVGLDGRLFLLLKHLTHELARLLANTCHASRLFKMSIWDCRLTAPAWTGVRHSLVILFNRFSGQFVGETRPMKLICEVIL